MKPIQIRYSEGGEVKIVEADDYHDVVSQEWNAEAEISTLKSGEYKINKRLDAIKSFKKAYDDFGHWGIEVIRSLIREELAKGENNEI